MDFGAPSTGNESCVDTVRALHQTIYALRTALEKSRDEILELKENSLSTAAVKDTISNLSIENHVLRQKVVNTEETKPKKIKRRASKEKIDTYRNIDVNFEKGNRKTSKSCEDISIPESPRKLSKSRTVCFSNTFEDERQVSTCNSLHIPLLRRLKSDKILTKNNINKQSDKSKSKNGDSKSNKNSLFKEEIVRDDLKASKNGSITDFIREAYDRKSTKKLIEDRGSKSDERVKNSKNKIKTERNSDVEIPSISKVEIVESEITEKNKNIDRKTIDYRETNQSSVTKTNECHKTSVKTIKYKETSDKTIGCQETSAKTIECTKVIENNSAKEESTETKESILKKITDKTEKVEENVKSITDFNQFVEKLPIKPPKTSDQELKKEKLKLINKDLAEFEGKIETSRKTDRKKSEFSEISENGTKTVECEETGVKKIEYTTKAIENNSAKKKSLEIKGDIPKQIEDTGIADDDIQTPLNKIDALPTSQEAQTDSNTSSETSSTVNEKKVEVSVKIYKGLKKPIEIDIQTKKKHRSPKKAPKQAKMNNKSQNTTPYEKEYSETVNRISPANNIVTNLLQNDVEHEVDEVELIFTTDDTKETDFKEELVPIDNYADTQLLPCPLSDYDEKLESSDRELEDDVFNDNFENENQENCNFQSQTYDFRRENSQIYNSKSDNSINHEDKSFRSYYSYQDSSFENKSLEKDESFDRFEEKTRIIETDISKIGIQDVEYNLGRRNTCPNPIQYRPIMHREALGRGLNSRKCRPILAHSNVIRKESGAQTDISALPGSSWRSESSLGHKVKIGENFTTLPSKFPHPGSRLRLSEKTVEARRVLLSDIGFTSMVPELSRSADHLFPPVIKGPVVSSYGQFLRTTDLYSPAYTSQKFVWTTTTPSEGSHSQSRYSSQYPLSSPPAPTRRCSAPVSPSKRTAVLKTTPSRVRFANGSLPELRGDWTATVDSGESTDSLVEEAEHFLRRSIDCLAPCKEISYRSDTVKMGGRRASAPEPSRDNVPPQGWQPFLPRVPRDLHLDYWVKVISPEGRVRGGRVRYVGPLLNQPEAFVGVQLSTPDGHSDGTYNNRRYFNCEPYHGLFVPFKKIIMGWRP